MYSLLIDVPTSGDDSHRNNAFINTKSSSLASSIDVDVLNNEIGVGSMVEVVNDATALYYGVVRWIGYIKGFISTATSIIYV